MKIKLYDDDIASNANLSNVVAIDTETMGLNPIRDRLCLIQLSSGNGVCHLIKINDLKIKPKNLLKILKNNKILKIFHYARFDVAILKYTYNIKIRNIYCTKIASKLARTYTNKHGYKDLCKELLNKTISKSEQTSDWGGQLTKEQQKYAATDVYYLHKIKNILDKTLIRENRKELAQSCFDFIDQRTTLDLLGWAEQDIFQH
tara:strand:+ start:219 stop:827 length:609 start_codon:yes stop_codon:yes gene_type:complete